MRRNDSIGIIVGLATLSALLFIPIWGCPFYQVRHRILTERNRQLVDKGENIPHPFAKKSEIIPIVKHTFNYGDIDIVYFRDPITDLCYALTFGTFSHNTYAHTNKGVVIVPCEKIPSSLFD